MFLEKRNPDILILGEAPTKDEDLQGKQFVGEAGKLLRKALPGMAMERLAWQHAVRCYPASNTPVGRREAHACSPFLEADLEKYDFKAVLGVGGVPLDSVFPGASITKVHGVRFPAQFGKKTLWYYPVLHPTSLLRGGGEQSNAWPVFRTDIKEFFKRVDKWPVPVIMNPRAEDVLLPRTREEAEALLARCQEPLGVDIETINLRPMEPGSRLLCASLSDGKTTFAWPIDHPAASTDWGLEFLLEVMSTYRWIAHNAAFELIWAFYFARVRLGMPNWQPIGFEDSMACGRLYHERETIQSLGDLTRIHIGLDIKTVTGVDAANIMRYPIEQVLPYNGLDSWASRILYDKLRKHVSDTLYDHIIGSIWSTTEMEFQGLPVDVEAAEDLQAKWQGLMGDAADTAKSIYEVQEFERARQEEFQISSPEAVGIALAVYGKIDLPRTPDGRYSTDDQVLAPLADSNPLVKAVLDYREAAKNNSTYITPVLEAVKRYAAPIIHPSYSTMRTKTLRLSSEGPNIQNFPKRRHREIRRMIISYLKATGIDPEKFIFASFDYGQLEARLYGMLTKDPALCKSVISGEDIHAYWRDDILDIYPEYLERLKVKTNQTEMKKILKGGRDIIKTDFVFASFYGSIAKGISERTELPISIVQQELSKFWKRYPIAQRWLKAQRVEYQETGSVRHITGLVRHGILPGNEMINNPVQGLAAFVVGQARNGLAAKARELQDMHIHPRIDIHDDLTFILPADDDELLLEYIELIAQELVKVRFPWQIVPLSVEANIGFAWNDLSEVHTFVGDYVR